MLDPNLLPPHAVARWAVTMPDTAAVVEIGGRRLTYAELDHDARRWAAAFSRVGVDVGTHVATLVPGRIEAILALLGLAWLRAVEVPVNTAHRGSMLSYTLDFSDSTVLVVDRSLLDRLVEVASDLPQLETVIVIDGADPETAARLPFRVIDGADFLDGAEPDHELPGPAGRDVAALLFTSGTTGPSKAVIAPWGLIYSIWSWIPGDALEPGEGLYCALPMFHNSGRSGFTNAMARGGTYVFREKFSVTHFWEDVRATGCTVAALVGPLTSLVWSAPPAPDDADNPLRGVIIGPMIPDMEAFEERFGVRVATCYGQTEAGCPVATGWDHGPHTNCGRIRTSWPFNEVRIVDEDDEPVAPGVVGEMIVRSPEPWSMMLGYHRMPEATVEAWRNGWFHTGDAFRVDDGWFTFVDRLRDSIRRRGENISSFEVEAVLNDHPDVIEAAAVGVRTEHGDDEVFAALVVTDREGFDAAAFHAWAEQRLPRFMLPRYVETFEDLPRNQTTRRVRKVDLRERGVTETTWDATSR